MSPSESSVDPGFVRDLSKNPYADLPPLTFHDYDPECECVECASHIDPPVLNVALTGENILVLPDKTETHTEEGLEIPTVAQSRSRQGVIKCLGPLAAKESPEIKIGARLQWGNDLPSIVEVDGVEYMLLTPYDVQVIFLGNDNA